MIKFDENLGMPDLTYGWAKLTHEYCARLAYKKHGIESVSYRPFSGYGVDQDDSYPFPSICKRILANEGASEIKFGDLASKCVILFTLMIVLMVLQLWIKLEMDQR